MIVFTASRKLNLSSSLDLLTTWTAPNHAMLKVNKIKDYAIFMGRQFKVLRRKTCRSCQIGPIFVGRQFKVFRRKKLQKLSFWAVSTAVSNKKSGLVRPINNANMYPQSIE